MNGPILKFQRLLLPLGALTLSASILAAPVPRNPGQPAAGTR